MRADKTGIPLVYSCSGCSNVAQLANDVAVVLDRAGHVQMSCIAGVGGNVAGLVKLAKSNRPILAIDGCKVACVKKVLENHAVEPRWHLEITDFGIKKKESESCSYSDMNRVLHHVQNILATDK